MVKITNGNIIVSVRNLVEFILRSGDLDNRYGGSSKEAMAMGSKLHRKIQKKMGSSYIAEVPLKIEIPYDEFDIILEGRADGIIEEDQIVIDEIKCMYADIYKLEEPTILHKAQAMCYAYIYSVQNELESIDVQMTYVNIETEDVRRFKSTHNIKELTQWFEDVISEYHRWALYTFEHTKKRNETARYLEFPFEYREGQRDIVVSTYKSILQNRNLYIQAPTGVGKTMSAVFPTVKAMGEQIADKIFYLTAKTVTGTVAHEAFRKLRNSGLKIKSCSITAKDKMCVLDSPDCNPTICERACGHYDRINDAVFDIVTNEDDITRDLVKEYAQKHNVCPFEMGLDISNFVDAIVCDYNYAFDPTAKLKRYFSEGVKGEYIFLVDEAHNLVDRAREMYSARICKEDILKIKKVVQGIDTRLSAALEASNKNMLEIKRECKDKSYILVENIGSLALSLIRVQELLQEFIEFNKSFSNDDQVLDFFFELGNFLNIFELVDENYEICAKIEESGEFIITLMCINPSTNLRGCMDKSISTIMFSATLLPVNYYKFLLTGDLEDYAIYVNSPFDRRNRIITIASDVSTKYTRRNDNEYAKIANYIKKTVSAKVGNYMVFFPSYKFMEDVRNAYLLISSDVEVISQTNTMKESEREEFLECFEENTGKTLVAFCVMGGIFSEGIDLTDERLIGSIVVGTGFPQVCVEREIIKGYFDKMSLNGFDFAYRYPGINKVLQAAGRVIRTVSDMGVISLLDDRFLSREYKNLFPREWEDAIKVNISNVEQEVIEFWKG